MTPFNIGENRASSNKILKKWFNFLYDEAIFSIHYFQIENKVEPEKHVKASFITVRTNPTLGVGSNMGWGVSEQCWLYQIICGANLNSQNSPFDLFEQTPHGSILKNSIFRTLLTLVRALQHRCRNCQVEWQTSSGITFCVPAKITFDLSKWKNLFTFS